MGGRYTYLGRTERTRRWLLRAGESSGIFLCNANHSLTHFLLMNNQVLLHCLVFFFFDEIGTE